MRDRCRRQVGGFERQGLVNCRVIYHSRDDEDKPINFSRRGGLISLSRIRTRRKSIETRLQVRNVNDDGEEFIDSSEYIFN